MTFKTKELATAYFQDRETKFGDRILRKKWQKDFLTERGQYNDDFDASDVPRTVWVHGFDKVDTPESVLSEFFGLFDGAESVRKRLYRDHRDDDADWRFTGSVFLTFDRKESAEIFMESDAQGLNFKVSSLTLVRNIKQTV